MWTTIIIEGLAAKMSPWFFGNKRNRLTKGVFLPRVLQLFFTTKNTQYNLLEIHYKLTKNCNYNVHVNNITFIHCIDCEQSLSLDRKSSAKHERAEVRHEE